MLCNISEDRNFIYTAAEASNHAKPEINHLNAQLNSICHLLALLGAHNILHVNRLMVNS